MGPLVLGIGIAVGLLILAIVFLAQTWRESRRREPGLSAADSAYFRKKDARRLTGSMILVLIGVAMLIGVVVDPRDGRTPRAIWAVTWTCILCLVPILLALALWDWIDLRGYAARQRRLLEQERRSVVEQARKLIRPPDAGDSTR